MSLIASTCEVRPKKERKNTIFFKKKATVLVRPLSFAPAQVKMRKFMAYNLHTFSRAVIPRSQNVSDLITRLRPPKLPRTLSLRLSQSPC